MQHQRRGASKENERHLRLGRTDAEALVWRMLRDRRFLRLKFRRQHRVGLFILDFYCPALRLGIELDGKHHFTEQGVRYDEFRSAMLEKLDIRIVRFENRQVLEDPPFILRQLELIALLRADELFFLNSGQS